MTHRLRHSRPHSRGFTLIEALAAIAVLAIVIPVLLEGFNVATGIAGLTRQTSNATLIAQSKLDELVATDSWNTGNMQASSESMGPDVFDWSYSVDAFDSEINVNTLTVTVQWNHRGSQRNVSVSTIVYTPSNINNNGNTNTGTSGTPGLGGGSP